MRNLLSAHLLRLRKSVLFWGTLVFMAGYAVWQIRFWISLREVTINPMIFDYMGVIGPVAAVWSSLFLGTDYSDGTLRNKLVAGYTRQTIYFAGLIMNIAVALLQCVVYLAVAFGLGCLLIGPPTMEAGRLLSLFASTVATVAAFCAIFTAIGMLCSQRIVTAVICIVGSFVLFGYMSTVDSYLNSPKYMTAIDVHPDREADVIYEINDGYVSGMRRVIFEFLDDALPPGQAVQYARNRQRMADLFVVEVLTAEQLETYMQYQRPDVDPLRLAAYSLAVTASSTAAGLVLFRRKDLK